MATAGRIPWYKEKHPKESYLKRGNPQCLTEEDLNNITGWVPPTDEEIELWLDSKSVIDQKNKKREFWIKYDKEPQKTPDGLFRMEVQVLHLDYQGIIFAAEAATTEEVQKRVWPIVNKLLAHFFSPRLSKRAELHLQK